jgi:hypothetical protein
MSRLCLNCAYWFLFAYSAAWSPARCSLKSSQVVYALINLRIARLSMRDKAISWFKALHSCSGSGSGRTESLGFTWLHWMATRMRYSCCWSTMLTSMEQRRCRKEKSSHSFTWLDVYEAFPLNRKVEEHCIFRAEFRKVSLLECHNIESLLRGTVEAWAFRAHRTQSHGVARTHTNTRKNVEHSFKTCHLLYWRAWIWLFRCHVCQPLQDGRTNFIAAAQNGHLEVVRFLMEHKADIHLASKVLCTQISSSSDQ